MTETRDYVISEDLVLSYEGIEANQEIYLGNNAFWYYGDLTIDWGDGSQVTTVTNPEDYDINDDGVMGAITMSPVPSHIYTTAGDYDVTISGNIVQLDGQAFADGFNEDIVSVIFPPSLTEMGSSAFYFAPDLTSITIQGRPEVNTYFNEEKLITEITFTSTVPPVLGSGALSGISDECVIRVPTGSLSAYTSASNYPSSSTYTYVEYTPQTPTPQTLINLYGHLRTLHKQWFYDKTEMTTGYVQFSDTTGHILNTGEIDTNTYLTATDISGKINSSSLSTVATTGSYNDLIDKPSTFTPSVHGHDADEVTDNQAYTNIGSSANDTQDLINSAINSTIGALLGVELIEVVQSLGSASASTMDKLYLVPEETSETDDSYEIFVSVRTGTSPNYTYSWEKLDTTRINLTGLASVSHVHGNIANAGTIGTNADYFAYTTTGGTVTSKEKIGNIDTSGAIGSDSGKVAVTTTGGEVTVSDWYQELDGLVVDLINQGLSQQQNNNGN